MEFRVLGPVELWFDDRKVELGRAKERCLLGVLLLSSGRPVTTRTLLDALWDDTPPGQARKSIQAYVSRLRKALRQVGSSARIATQHESYTLHVGDDEVDYLRFKMLLNQGRALRRENRLDASAHVLHEATALWSGPPLADLRTGWMERRREDLEGYDRLAAYQELCDVQLERGAYQDVLRLLDDAMEGHEFDTKYIGQRLTALDGAGQYPEFDAYWKRVYRQTVESFGTGPGRDLHDLYGRLLQKRDALVPWQRTHPSLAEIRRPPAQLPATVNDFVGRKDELAHLDQLLMRSRLSDPAGTLVMAITGPAGVGKTELALRWAHGVKEQFPYGQLYVDLAGYSARKPADPAAVLAELLTALGAARAEIPEGVTARGALFRTMLDGRQALLFLDNARDSEQVRSLLPGSDKCVVVVTSRHRLTDLVTRHGAYRSSLAPLGHAECLHLVQTALSRSGLRPSASLLEAMVRLCAGSPQFTRSAVDLVIRRFDVVLGGRALSDGDIPAVGDVLGHGEGVDYSLKSSLLWSCRALPSGAARMFSAFGRCPCGDLSEEALSALSATLSQHFRADLEALISLHLVGFEGGRYRIVDMYRHFCAECTGEFLSDSDFLNSMSRLLGWYEHAVDRASAVLFVRQVDTPSVEPGSPRFADRTAAGTWLADELGNLIALVDFSAAFGQSPAWRIPVLLQDYLAVRRLWDEWKSVHESGLRAAEKVKNRRAEIDLLNGLAVMSGEVGNLDAGLRCVERALASEEAERSAFLKAQSLRVRASLHRRLGRIDRAHADYAEAVLLLESEDRRELARTLYDLSLICLGLGRLGEASGGLWRALAIQNELNDLVGKSATMAALSQLCRQRGDDDEAREFCLRVLELRSNEALGYADSLYALVTLAEISCDRREFDSALGYSRQAIILCHTPADHRLAARALVSLVLALVGTGRLDQARTEARHALAIIQEVDAGKVAEVREEFESLGALTL